MLDRARMRAALGVMAKVHAFFWQGSDFSAGRTQPGAMAELEARVWSFGTYGNAMLLPTWPATRRCARVFCDGDI